VRRAAALGLVLLVFLAGLAGGALGARLVLRRAAPWQQLEHAGAPALDRFFPHRDLDLTPQQRQRLQEIFSRQRARFEELHRELRPRVDALMAEIDREVEAILTPEQLERYRQRPARWRHGPRRHGPDAHHGPPPPPGDPPPAPPGN